jgi:uncharacterized protein (TIGR03382 family)
MLLTLLSFASADADMMLAPCMGPVVTATLPAAGATEVPVDALPAFVWHEDCGEAGDFKAELYLEGELVFEQHFPTAGGVGLERLELDATLQPDSEYLLHLSGVDQDLDVEFSTGQGAIQGAEAPTLVSVGTEAWKDGGLFYLYTDVEATTGADPDSLSALMLLDEQGELVDVDVQPRSWLSASSTSRSLPEELCFSLVQVDGLGAQSEPLETCSAPVFEGRMGCSSAPVGASMLAGLLALLLTVRRRTWTGS